MIRAHAEAGKNTRNAAARINRILAIKWGVFITLLLLLSKTQSN